MEKSARGGIRAHRCAAASFSSRWLSECSSAMLCAFAVVFKSHYERVTEGLSYMLFHAIASQEARNFALSWLENSVRPKVKHRMISERGTNLAVAAAAARAASEAPPQEGAAAPLEMKAASATFSKHSLERKRRREGGREVCKVVTSFTKCSVSGITVTF